MVFAQITRFFYYWFSSNKIAGILSCPSTPSTPSTRLRASKLPSTSLRIYDTVYDRTYVGE